MKTIAYAVVGLVLFVPAIAFYAITMFVLCLAAVGQGILEAIVSTVENIAGKET